MFKSLAIRVLVLFLVLCPALPALPLRAGPSQASTAAAPDDEKGTFADFAVGAPGEAHDDVIAGAGAVSAFYRRRGAPGDYVVQDAWTQDDLPPPSSAEASDGFGSVLAAGDFDGNGHDDLAAGSPLEDIYMGANYADAGTVQVLYAGANGLSPDGATTWWQGSGTALEDTPETGDQFGAALAAGDFNGDGYDDLAAGVPYEHVGDIADAGAVHVLYGSPTGLATEYVADQFWTQDTGAMGNECEPDERFGSALAAGDFDADGYDDLAIGVPYESYNAVAGAGAVNIVYGSAEGLTDAGNKIFDQAMLGFETLEHDYFGSALAAGRIGGAKYDDLAIGAPGRTIREFDDAGAVYIMYGGSDGLEELFSQRFSQDTLTEDPFVDEYFGSALAVGDLNLDGYGDLAVGVPGEDLDGKLDAGGVNIILGTSGRLSTDGNVFWSEKEIAGGPQAGDQVGYALAIGRLDAGYGNLIVGVPYSNYGDVLAAGAIHILHGSPGDVFWPLTGWVNLRQGSWSGPGEPEADDHFGLAVVVGNFYGSRSYLPLVVRAE